MMTTEFFKNIIGFIAEILEYWVSHRTNTPVSGQPIPQTENSVKSEPIVPPVSIPEVKVPVVVKEEIVYTEGFKKAFSLIMESEVGPFFNENDLATQQGLIDTQAHRRNCGYNITTGDRGGETKFGIAQNANPNVNVKTLTLSQAKEIYYSRYWLASHSDKIQSPLDALHFDSAVNHGIGAAAKLLQTALNITADGVIGKQTIAAVVACQDVKSVCSKYLTARQHYYDAIVLHNPSQAKFAAGWANRITSLRLWLSKQ